MTIPIGQPPKTSKPSAGISLGAQASQPPETRSPEWAAWALVGLALVAVLVFALPGLRALSAPGAAEGGASSATAAVSSTATVYHIEASDMRFVPDSITVPAGQEVALEITNADAMTHDLEVAGRNSGRLAPGDTVTLELGVVDSDLEGWCTVAGHRQAGMTFSVAVS